MRQDPRVPRKEWHILTLGCPIALVAPRAAWYRGQAGDLGMSITIYTRLAVLTIAAYYAIPSAVGQGATPQSISIEERIQHVTSGLIGGVVLKGQEHNTHTLVDRMK